MALRPCLGLPGQPCGRLTSGSRCPDCKRVTEYRHLQRKRARRPRIAAEDKRRADTVQAWRAEHGDWCPGWQVPPHSATDLTADHVVAVAADGDERGPLTVLCRPCNARKGARPA